MTDMDDNVQDLFQDDPRFKQKLAVVADSEDAPNLYTAFSQDANPTRIRIIQDKETVNQLRYAFMEDQSFIGTRWLALIFSRDVFLLHGRHLDQLMYPLQEEKISRIECFDPDTHPMPDDDTVPVITRITRYTMKDFEALMKDVEKREDTD